MKNLSFRLLAMLSGGVVAAAGVVMACSSDDTIVTNPDASPLDGGKEGSSDADTNEDAKTDVKEPLDAGLTPANFAGLVADALCRGYAKCCFGNENLDAGAKVDAGDAGYDQQGCLKFYQSTGYTGSSTGLLEADESKYTIDQTKGAECLQKLKSLACGAINATEHKAIRSACFNAIVGKLGAGQPCVDSAECTPGNFCNKGAAPDGGAGVCEAVRAANVACGNTQDPVLAPEYAAAYADEVCSYRAGGDSYCTYFTFNPDGGEGWFNAKADWKCKAGQATGSDCANDSWCAAGSACAYETSKCGPSDTNFPPDTCNSFIK
jgi:hypothetical protein